VFDFIPGCHIELAYSLEDALDDVWSGTGLKNALQVVIAPMTKHLVLYPMSDIMRRNVWENK